MSVKKFMEIYNRKLSNDADIKKNPKIKDGMYDFRDRITFMIGYRSSCPAVLSGSSYTNILELDAEDLEYLANKYKQKLRDEMAEELLKVLQSYKDLL